MSSSTSSSKTRDAESIIYDSPDPTINWLPPGPDQRGCPAYRDPAAITMAVAFALVLLIGLTRNDPQESRDPDWYWMMKANWIEECPLVIAGEFVGSIDPISSPSRLGQTS